MNQKCQTSDGGLPDANAQLGTLPPPACNKIVLWRDTLKAICDVQANTEWGADLLDAGTEFEHQRQSAVLCELSLPVNSSQQ